MKTITFIIFFLLSNTISANEGVSLEWKINKDEVVAYKTKMSPPKNDSDNFIKIDVEKILEEKSFDKELKNSLSELKLPNDYEMTSVLKGIDDKTISVKMIIGSASIPTPKGMENQKIQKEMNNLLEKIKNAVQLRGEINNYGFVKSFYLEQKQKNLIAMLFELPDKTVYKGDEWSIDFSCLSMGAGYINEKADKLNKVQLSDIMKDNNKTIALIDYLLTEKVVGKMHNPITNQVTPISMSCSYVGRHEFSINEGKLLKASGEFVITSKGFMNSNVKQKVVLIPIDNVPKEFGFLE